MAETITGTEGADTINNYDSGVIIRALGGRDIITNSQYRYNYDSQPDSVTIDAGNGNDSIHDDGEDVEIDGGDGNDFIYNTANALNAIIDGGKGADSIYNEA